MARKKRGNPIHGWLIIDKVEGMGSTDVVRAIKRILHPQKIGHGGTLDPLATGVLPIAMGEATKTMPFILDSTKVYEFGVKWGQATSTDDREGDVIEASDVRPIEADIEGILAAFTGEIQQVPPAFSAIKVDGKRAYELARRGDDVELKPRNIEVISLKLLQHDGDESHFEVVCGKGTYVRSLSRDMAVALGTVGHASYIRRTRVGPFSLEGAISLEKLDELSHIARALEAVLPVATALDDIPALAVTADEAVRIKRGQQLRLPTERSGTMVLTSDGQVLAIVEVADGVAQPVRVFNL